MHHSENSSSATAWRVDSETGRLRDVLLCRPEHYSWIPTNDIARRTLAGGISFDRAAVAAQYGEFEQALEEAGVRLHFLPPQAGLPYQVYTRDSSQMTPWGVAHTRLAMPQRREEHPFVEAFYRAHGVPVWQEAPEGLLEGGDIHIIRPGLIIIGQSGGRTDAAGAEALAAAFRAEGWEAVVVPFAEHFLHLDVIFSMVTDGLALACSDVLDDDFLALLAARGIRLIPVSYKEAMNAMACNVVALGDARVLSPRHSTRVNKMLRAEGIQVFDPELSMLAAGGGSAHCMSMPLRRDPV